MKFPSKEIVENLRKKYPAGSRVELTFMDDIQAPPIGTKGTVKGVDDTGSIMVSWDNGSSLSVVYQEDYCRLLITDTLKKQIEKVRASKKTNMLDVRGVSYIAYQMNLYELVLFIKTEKDEYFHYLFNQK